MSSVLFVVHPDRPAAKELASAARAWWAEHGYDVVEGATLDSGPFAFAVSFGGDGTMLRTLQCAQPTATPVLGINLGRMGYLAEVEPSGMRRAFERLVSGDYTVELRTAIEVTVHPAHGRGAPHSYVAHNEAIVEREAPGHTIRVGVEIGGSRFLTYVADGLLVCTPTGSTAYNLSARGPVVSPSLQALVLTPVAPHLVFDRSLVLSPEEPVRMTLMEGRPGALVLDGRGVMAVGEGDSVSCEVCKQPARYVSFGDTDFHDVLRSRFSLTDR